MRNKMIQDTSLRSQYRGFTLAELLIVLAVIGILSAIAIPAYSGYVLRGKRAEARATLDMAAQQMERYFSSNNTYAAASLPARGIATTSSNGNYNISLGAVPAGTTADTGFTLLATPVIAGSDPVCGVFGLDSTGLRTISGTGTVQTCWGR